ncbi:hypothetical protein CDAR_491981 [Caerostris darwini]|uniref:Uncharacterized protein n=1 Tax=Caerostris darwini TaxID=1538125 RepID=A0AAV4VKA9_9ARAC|nr:hypothetical protein CDAR_491981 [Caerostris darwini]
MKEAGRISYSCSSLPRGPLSSPKVPKWDGRGGGALTGTRTRGGRKRERGRAKRHLYPTHRVYLTHVPPQPPIRSRSLGPDDTLSPPYLWMKRGWAGTSEKPLALPLAERSTCPQGALKSGRTERAGFRNRPDTFG